MADAPDEDENEVSFISALDDAELRLKCYQSVAGILPDMSHHSALAAAKELYSWLMDDNETADEVPEEPDAKPTEDSCVLKH